MNSQHLLVTVIVRCARHGRAVVLAGVLLGGLASFFSVTHLGLDSETDRLFAADLPWRQRMAVFKSDFPQFQNLLVAVIDGREPEQAEVTATALTEVLSADRAHFRLVHRPDGSAFFRHAGMLFLDSGKLEATLDRIIDAQPFLGELTKDPSARGLFAALALLAKGVEQGIDLEPYRPALSAFHDTMAATIAGQPRPLSWIRLLAADLAEAGGPYKFVLAQPVLDHSDLEPGGSALRAMREAAGKLAFVRSGDARVRITGNVALADEEFATVAQGAVEGMIASTLLITLWLFLAVRSWRFIVPILLTLVLGLLLTLMFAAVTVGTLNLISVGFGILFVGIAVDFAIQFCVRYREMCQITPNAAAAMAEVGRRAGHQILIAAAATAAGFLSFVPTDFRGVAELGLIAGAGMLIAFCCTMTFLPAAIAVCKPRDAGAEAALSWAAPLDELVRRRRWAFLALFGLLGALGVALTPRLVFDANPLHTKDPTTEAMRTLEDLREAALANPFTAHVMARDVAAAAELGKRLRDLPLVLEVLSLNSFVPDDQETKLALIADARNLLSTTLSLQSDASHPEPEQIRASARAAAEKLDRVRDAAPADPGIAALAGDLHQFAGAPDAVLQTLDRMLMQFLPLQLDRLRDALQAPPVTMERLPPELVRDWLLPDGRARLQVIPRPEARNSDGLAEFVAQVISVAPDASGPAPTIAATSQTIVASFRSAAILALVAITAILVLALRRLLDVALVLAPLLLSSLMTVAVLALAPLPLNYANIIALPLLLGVGVSFNIYFVMNWRAGQSAVLGSPTARAILFSALTTATAFGSLALSRHPGTASMGWLLLISLGCTLAASLFFLPALLAALPPPGLAAVPEAEPRTS